MLFKTNHPWYYLDPDHRKKDPETGLFCARCKKGIKPGGSLIAIEIHPNNPWFRINPLGNKLIGNDCFEKVKKEYGEMKL